MAEKILQLIDGEIKAATPPFLSGVASATQPTNPQNGDIWIDTDAPASGGGSSGAISAVTEEPAAPASGGILFMLSGALKFKDASGNVSTIVAAPVVSRTDRTSSAMTHMGTAPQSGYALTRLSDDVVGTGADNSVHGASLPSYWAIDLGTAVAITQLRVHSGAVWYSGVGALKVFTYQATNSTTDGIDGTWTTLLTVTNNTDANASWQEWEVSNTTAYRYYRLAITEVWDWTNAVIAEWEMLS